MQRLEQKNQQTVGKVLRKGKINLVIEEIYYKDIPPNEREEYTEFFKKIWNMPLLHNQRSTHIIQAFWKQILRRSYLSHKSKACEKYICQYGEHYRQKFSLYYPKQKHVTLLPVIVFIHGGYFINGTQQAFEYLGKAFVEKGYLIATMGFRQLPQYRWPDPYDDCHTGFQNLVNIAQNYGGDPNNIIYVSWSGGGMVTLTNFFRFPQQYQPRVKLHVALGSPWQVGVNERKVASVFVDDPATLSQVFPYGYMGQKLSIPINLITGTQDKQFPQIWQHNIKYFKIYKQNGLNVTLDHIENHDHYDLILNVDLALTKIRQFEIKNISPTNEITQYLSNGHSQLKNRIFDELKQPIWKKNTGESLDKQRLDTIVKFRKIQNFIGDGLTDYNKLFSILEFFSLSDSSACTKTLTHLSSCGTINFIGTDKHKKYLSDVSKGKIVFAFALTQAGGGNNLSEAGTKATYDNNTKQFIFHNETHYSKKFWCANLGVHANYAVVFANLIVNKKSQGTHAFIVRIRDQNHKPMPGVILQDLHHKIALNGIDNGTLMFNNYKVSKEALLNRIGDVDDQGNYKSNISSTHGRFFKVIESLIAGRLFIASTMTGIIKHLCNTAITFSRYRFGISQTGMTQIPIGNYQLQQNDLIPAISKSIALLFFHNHCKYVFLNNQKNPQLSNLCNLDKILLTQHGTQLALVTRERCGGQGVISINQIGEHLGVSIAASTGQGDNKMLIIKIAKDCLKLIGQKKLQLSTSPIIKITSIQQLENLDILLNLLQKRQIYLFKELTSKIIKLKEQRKQVFQISMKHTWQQMKAFSYAYGDRVVLSNIIPILSQFNDADNLYQLKTHFIIYALTCIINHPGFYAYSGIIPQQIAKNIILLRNKLIKSASKRVQLLVHKLDLPSHVLTAPISRPNYFKHVQTDLKQNPLIPPKL